MEFTLVSSVAVDSKDRVFVCQRGDPPIVVFDSSGEYIGAWGSGVVADPHGISVSRDDRVWVVDRDAHQVLAFDSFGHHVLSLGERHRPQFQRPFNHPADVAVADSGDIFIADGYGNSVVHRFDREGRLQGSWGSPGSGDGQFTTPHAIWLDRDERVLVADRENNRIQVFDQNGVFLGGWYDFYHPMDLYQDVDGLIYVTDQIPRVSVINAYGELVGRGRPVLYGAHGIWGDSKGDFYLAEGRPTNRLTKLICVEAADR
jgi:peptidylglycine monooxygenase